MKTKNSNIDYKSKVNISIEYLYELKKYSYGFNFLPNYKIQSLLSGNYLSNLLGQGLDFQEVREYVLGDDIRKIDWKISARTNALYSKVYTEERERGVWIITDQSSYMKFGTVNYLKSVIAGEIAGLSFWRIFEHGDKIGSVVFNDIDYNLLKPSNVFKNKINLLSNLEIYNNHLLDSEIEMVNKEDILKALLSEIDNYKENNQLLIFITDILNISEDNFNRIMNLRRDVDIIIFNINDIAELELPEDNVNLRYKDLYLEIDKRNKKIFQEYKLKNIDKIRKLQAQSIKNRIPIISMNTKTSAIEQIRTLLNIKQ
ncbi:DUF58 domain-containing protein [Marinilabiliaceae bacterium JC040]|nr:DUF58 domain-containing protein [Marinilabiliaceae bacterium JC040]